MRLFILDRTPLRRLDSLPDPPRAGDVVAYLRHGQDADGTESERLERAGVHAVWGEGLVSDAASEAIDDLGGAFLRDWFVVDGADVSRSGELSFGELMTSDLGRLTNPRFVIRTGEIVRLLIASRPEAAEIVSDLADGEGIDRVRPAYLPLATVARHVAAAMGKPYREVAAVEPLPPLVVMRSDSRLRRMLWSWLGGFRPRWLRARMRNRRAAKKEVSRPSIYLVGGRGMAAVARRLVAGGRFRVVSGDFGVAGAESVRHDQLFALPSLTELHLGQRIVRHARDLATGRGKTDPFRYNGIGYGPILARALTSVLDSHLLLSLVIAAQARKLQRVVNFSALLINGEGGFFVSPLVALNRNTDRRIYLVRHGMNVHRMTTHYTAHNNSHVVYIACGEDHRAEYGVHLPEAQKPRTPVVGSPLTALMSPLRGRRAEAHGRRLLVLSYGYSGYQTATRMRACDKYFIDVFGMARVLLGEGWSVSCRGHPNHPHELQSRIAAELGLGEAIVQDRHAELADALLAHDVVISSVTSALYQSLFAGWPTIFYEPDCRPAASAAPVMAERLFVGLPVAHDIDRPVATDPEHLLALIRETLDPGSPTSLFPDRFATEHARRFIGPRPSDSHAAVAEFLEQDFFDLATAEPGPGESCAA